MRHGLRATLKVAAAISVLLSGRYVFPGQAAPPPQTAATVIDSPEIIEARKILKQKLERNPGIKKVIIHPGSPGAVPTIDYYDPIDHANFSISLPTTLTDTIAAIYVPGSPVMHDGWKVSYTDYVQMHEYYWLSSKWSQSDAEEIVRTLKILVLDARHWADVNMEAGFQKMVRACSGWPAVKLPMPDDARRHKALAEAAYRGKDFDTALDEYRSALDIYPCWPEGQFNRASIAGDTGWYPLAIANMKRYIWLVPDAPDVQAAKGQIAIWEAKMGR